MTNEEHIDPEQRIKLLQEDIAFKELLIVASVDALNYTLELAEDDRDDAINFLDRWNEGDWKYLIEHYPEFNIMSEAQQALIKESGGMPS